MSLEERWLGQVQQFNDNTKSRWLNDEARSGGKKRRYAEVILEHFSGRIPLSVVLDGTDSMRIQIVSEIFSGEPTVTATNYSNYLLWPLKKATKDGIFRVSEDGAYLVRAGSEW